MLLEFAGKKMAMKMAMVSKMDRSELEDKYIRLYEQYLVIKVHAQKQEEKIKRYLIYLIDKCYVKCFLCNDDGGAMLTSPSRPR